MGVTLHGLIEVCMSGAWEDVARIQFGKNYDLMRVLHENATSGWPRDLSFEAREMERRGIDSGRAWCSASEVCEILEMAPPDGDESSEWVMNVQSGMLKAAHALMDSLEKDRRVVEEKLGMARPFKGSTRILFYEL